MALPNSESVINAIGCGIPAPTMQICSMSVFLDSSNSIGDGETYLPLSVLNWSLTRPIIVRNPSWSYSPQSPVLK